MKKQMSEGQLIFRLVAACIVVAAVLIFFFYSLNRFVDGKVQDFSDGWTVNYNGQAAVDADLYKYRFPSRLKRGDIITLEKKIPSTIGDEMILTFNGQLSACSVKVDGEDIYNYGYQLIYDGDIPGDATHNVLLPTDAAGTVCEVSIEVGMDDAFRTLPLFHLVPAQNVTACYTNLHVISNVIALFLFTMGIVILVASIILGCMRKNYKLSFAIGALSFVVGIWTLCTTHMIEMFSRNYVFNTKLEYLSLYFSIIPLLSVMYLIKKPGKQIWQKACVGMAYAVICTFLVIVCLSDLTKTMHPAAFLIPAQVVSLASILFMILGTYTHKEERGTTDKIYDVALIILFAGCIYDVLRYYISTAIKVDSGFLFISVIPPVSFIFIIMMQVAYLKRIDDHYMHEAELEIADQIAFTDVVTGLKNRTYCNLLFERLEKRNPEDKFQIVSFDVNGVTKVNDTLGRPAGDMLIKDSAEILVKAFLGVGEVIRMGGDEFIAVIENGKYRDVKTSLSRMEKFEAQYELRRKYEIRLSYGVAASDEKEGMTPEAVYHRATERMYAMKKETKYSTY